METREILYLLIALVVIGLILVVLRRASKKSRLRASDDARVRLGVEPEAEAPRRVRRKPRPGQPAVAEVKPAPTPEPEPVVDVDARDAYKAGLAKTRGGFVAKLGKLFGKKKIDAQTLDELEE